jgi:hypothetical protein
MVTSTVQHLTKSFIVNHFFLLLDWKLGAVIYDCRHMLSTSLVNSRLLEDKPMQLPIT